LIDPKKKASILPYHYRPPFDQQQKPKHLQNKLDEIKDGKESEHNVGISLKTIIFIDLCSLMSFLSFKWLVGVRKETFELPLTYFIVSFVRWLVFAEYCRRHPAT
jgi:hypothetical protein